MIGLLIQFIIMALILGVLYYIAKLVVGYLGLPGIILQILGVLIVLIFVIWLLNVFLVVTGTSFALTWWPTMPKR